MKPRIILSAAAGFALAATAVQAIPFDNTTGGPVVATVGATGDYATLSAASIAFNGVAGGINREWTLAILENLTEAANLGFANSFGAGGKLIIKPAATVTPTITFTQTTAQAGTAFFGHLIIGSYAIDIAAGPNIVPSLTNTIASNGNYEIDGSNTVGGTTRDLTITTGEATTLVSAANNLIRIIGDSDGVVIKNTRVVFNDTGGTATAIGLAGCVISATNLAPDNVTLQNNLIQSSVITGTSINGAGIGTTLAASGTIPAGSIAIQNLTVVDNTIRANQRGVFMNGVGNATVSRNTITIDQTGTTTATVPIFHFGSNTLTGWTQTYDRNVLSVESNHLAAAGNGAYGILCDSGPTAGTYSITNNIIKGAFNINPTPADTLVRGISVASVASNYTIEHNSISIPATSATGVTANRVGGIVASLAFTTGTLVLRNNILRFAETDGTAVGIRLANATGVTATGNCLFVTGPIFARVDTTDLADFAAWQGLGFDIAGGSQNADPAASTPPWDANLRFLNKPTSGLTAVTSSTTLVDVDGNARPATGAIPGAQEPPDPSTAVHDWNHYF